MRALALVLFAAPQFADAAAGGLDVAFGTSGKVTTVVGTNTTTLTTAIAVQGDGRIIAAGWGATLEPLAFHVVLARYESDGDLDSTFGIGGIVVTTMPQSATVSAMLLQDDGKIVVVGSINGANDDRDWLIMRYQPDGDLDASFGTGGITTTSFTTSDDVAREVALEADGDIVVVGTRQFGTTGADIALARYDGDGLLDPAFGSGGTVITDLGGIENGNALVIQADGRIVVGGGRDVAVLVRYLDDGTVDGTFGTGGVVTAAGSEMFDLTLQPGGRLVAGLDAFPAEMLVGYGSMGAVDATFGVAGSVALPSVFNGGAIGSEADGDLLVSGGAGASKAVARYDASGTYDSGFGACGLAITAFEGAHATGLGFALQPDGRFLLGGAVTSIDGSLNHMSLARFESTGTLATCTQAATAKSRLTLKSGAKTKWKWVGPAPLAKGDFGPPTAGTDLTFCVLDQATASPIGVLTIAGTTAFCAMSSCWKETSAGFVGNRRWTGRLRMKALAPAGAPGKIVVTGRAAPAGTPDAPLATPLIARMARGDGGGCWEAAFSNPVRNGLTEGFVAFSD